MLLKLLRGGCAGLLLLAGLSFGGVLFSDDFNSVPNTQWIKNPDALSMKFENKVCTIANDDGVAGCAIHTLSSPPSTFTLSGKITFTGSSRSAGFVCCMVSSGIAAGYYVTIENNERVVVNKVDSSGTATFLLVKRCAYLTTGTNELKLSRKDGVFNVFCNGVFAGTFTDNKLPPGNIAMLVSSNCSAAFDDVVLTDAFETGSAPTCFADNFDDGDLLGWAGFGSGSAASVANVDSAMRITTGADQKCYRVIDLPLDSLVLRTVVTHRGGSTKKLYGLFVCGAADETDGTIPVAGFGINGDKNYAPFLLGPSFVLSQSTKIKGAAYIDGSDTTFYKDTLEVIRHDGSTTYLFIINGDTLSRYTEVNFKVTGAGIFAFDSLTVSFDDFLLAPASGACSVLNTGFVRRQTVASGISFGNSCEFDALGRITSRNAQAPAMHRASGMYLVRSNGATRLRLNTR